MRLPEQLIEFLNLLIYGNPGAGKTFLAGTAEDSELTAPLLFLDVEGGTLTIRHRKVDVVRISSTDQLVSTHKWLHDHPGFYKTVVIDSLSELQKLDMLLIIKDKLQRRPDQDPDVPDMRDWGKSSEHIRRIVRAYRDLPMNTIMTAHVAEYKDERTNITRFSPALPGKLRMEVPGFMDMVGYLTVADTDDGQVRRLQFAQTSRVMAKDRSGALGDVMENPTIPQMWELVKAADKNATQNAKKG